MTTSEESTSRYVGGRPDGPPLLLLHGLGMSWRAWKPLLPTLGEGHRLLAPTLPGHRGGPAAPADVRVSAFVDYLEQLLDNCGWDQAHVVGNSLGGWFALELARRGRALSVTALSPAGAYRHLGDQVRVDVLLRAVDAFNHAPWTIASLLPAMQFAPTRRLVLRQLMERGDRVRPEEARGILLDARGCTVVPGLVRSGHRDSFLQVDRLVCPTQVVWGRRDRVIPYVRHGRPLARRLPGVREVSLPGSGHVPMYDAPMLLTSLIKEYVVAGEAHTAKGSTR